MNPPDQSTPRTQAVWKTHCGFSNEDEATEAVCDFRDLSNTLERELAAAKAECERLKFALVEWEAKERGWSKAVEKDAAELTRLRDELASKTACYDIACGEVQRLRAEVERWELAFQEQYARAEKAEAELITERARLDYLGLHMGTRMVAEALNCDYSKCFPIRDAIDLAMKNETNP
jgi:hypothetical protein